MVVTLFGMVMLDKEEHHSKDLPPMVMTLVGMVTLAKDSQPAKA